MPGTDPWIRVVRRNGRDDESVCIGARLTAHDLAALSDPSLLVGYGTHRLLTAILHAMHRPQNKEEKAALLSKGKCDGDRSLAFGRAYAERFDLFDPHTPFLPISDACFQERHAAPIWKNRSPGCRSRDGEECNEHALPAS